MSRVRRAWAGLRWFVRELTGEARWDEYVAACAAAGREPVARQVFERHRDEHRERAGRSRCC